MWHNSLWDSEGVFGQPAHGGWADGRGTACGGRWEGDRKGSTLYDPLLLLASERAAAATAAVL